MTLADLARLAGVSTATASVALNNKPGVSESTRQRIIALAEEVGYRPNRLGRALRQSRTGAIGLYMPHTASSFGYYTETTRGVAEVLHGHDLSLLILPSSHSSESIVGFPPVDGFILMEPHSDDLGIRAILEQPLPVVSGDEPPASAGQPWGIVESPNEHSTRTVFDRFVARGARRPGLVLLERVSSWALDLERAYLQWCEERQLTPRVALTSVHRTNEELLEDLRAWFDPVDGCDAVLAGGDGIAIRIAGLLRTLGHVVGDTVLLASGVDSPMMEYHTPRITAVDLQPRHFGGVCADLLVSLMNAPQPPTPVRRVVDAPLIARESG